MFSSRGTGKLVCEDVDPRHTPELMMKHRPLKAVDTSPNHHVRANEAL